MDLSKLKIIKATVDPLARSNPSNVNVKSQETKTETPGQISESTIETINDGYNELRRGKLNQNDFNRKILKLDNRLLDDVSQYQKKEILDFLFETIKWYIQLKFLISTGLKAETLSTDGDIPDEYAELIPFLQFVEDLDQPDVRSCINPKDTSHTVKSLLELFINDDIIQPKYKINSEMLMYLHNQRPTFLNEITVLFDLYSKYYDQISRDFLEGQTFRSIKQIQPRFDMINRHILSSNLKTRVDYDLDLSKISTDETNIGTSQLGLQKRLNHLNSWLTNGIIHTQSSINRFSALKPVTKATYRGLNDLNNQPIISRYDLWIILRDTKSFLESLKGLVDGTAFITGIQSGDILDVLEVNY